MVPGAVGIDWLLIDSEKFWRRPAEAGINNTPKMTAMHCTLSRLRELRLFFNKCPLANNDILMLCVAIKTSWLT